MSRLNFNKRLFGSRFDSRIEKKLRSRQFLNSDSNNPLDSILNQNQ